jgi:hypothetical protein
MKNLTVNVVNALCDSLENHFVIIAGDNFHLFANHEHKIGDLTITLDNRKFCQDAEIYYTPNLSRMLSYIQDNLK